MTDTQSFFAGHFRFSLFVPPERVLELAKGLKEHGGADRFSDMHVRGNEGSGLYIAFRYQLDGNEQKHFREAFFKLKQFLIDKLGPDPIYTKRPNGVVDWDISTVHSII